MSDSEYTENYNLSCSILARSKIKVKQKCYCSHMQKTDTAISKCLALTSKFFSKYRKTKCRRKIDMPYLFPHASFVFPVEQKYHQLLL